MTEWVLLIPTGDTAQVHNAKVDRPTVCPAEAAAVTIRRLALERELAELRDLEDRAGIHMPEPHELPAWPADLPVDAAMVPVPAHPSMLPPPVAERETEPTGPRGLERRVGADGVVRYEAHHEARVPGPQWVCFCGHAFTVQANYNAHRSACDAYSSATTARGQGIPGAHVWGNTTGHVGPLGGAA